MSLLSNKTILLTGIASNRSIAYYIGKACIAQGATLVITYPNDRMKERVLKLCQDWPNVHFLPCDVAEDSSIHSLADSIGQLNLTLDGLVHAIAYADRDQIQGDFVEHIKRERIFGGHEHQCFFITCIMPSPTSFDESKQQCVRT